MNTLNLFTKISLIFIITIGIFYASLGFSNKNVPALEIIEFHTPKNISTQQVLDASKKLTNSLKKHKGFINRTLTQDSKDPNSWTDIIEWKSIDDGVTAMKSEADSDSMLNFIDLMKEGHKTFKSKSNPDIDISYLNIKSQS